MRVILKVEDQANEVVRVLQLMGRTFEWFGESVPKPGDLLIVEDELKCPPEVGLDYSVSFFGGHFHGFFFIFID